MPPSDAALLTAYARDRDEGAFRQLAERHFALIYHTALRRTDRHILAQEVSQNVLCLLARKAASLLMKADRLPAWLHRATVLEAAKAIRQEATSQRHAALQHPDEIPGTAIPPDPGLWESCLPFLDEALDSLPESDRQVLALHYLENLSFPRISELSGKPAATLQKQSIRALAKLSSILTWRIRSGRRVRLQLDLHSSLTAAVTAGMKAESAKAAPVSLIPAMTHTAVTSAAAPTLLTQLILMSATHSKAILGGTLLLLALPLGFQQFSIARTRAELAGIPSTENPVPSRPRPEPRTVSAISSADSELLELSEEAITSEKVEPVRLKLLRRFSAMSFRDLVGLLDRIDASSLGAYRREMLQRNVTVFLMELDPEGGMAALESHGLLNFQSTVSAYADWLRRDLRGAVGWIEEALDRSSLPEQRKSLTSYLGRSLQQLLASDPSLTGALLDRLSPEEALEAIRSATPSNPSASLDHLPGEAEAVAWLEILRHRVPADEREALLGDFGMMYYKGEGCPSFDNLKPLEHLDLPLDERRIIAKAVAEKSMTGRGMSQTQDLSKMDSWLEKFIPEEAGSIAASGQEQRNRQQEQEQLDALNYLQNASFLSDDELVRALTGSNFGSHIDQALIVASHVKDPGKRAAIEAEIRNAR